jgi:hypothetical protein
MGAGSEIQQNEVAGVKPMTAVVKASKKTSGGAYSGANSRWEWPMEG